MYRCKVLLDLLRDFWGTLGRHFLASALLTIIDNIIVMTRYSSIAASKAMLFLFPLLWLYRLRHRGVSHILLRRNSRRGSARHNSLVCGHFIRICGVIFLTIVRKTANQLSDYPASGKPGRLAGTRELFISGSPYVVFYTVQHNIVTISHGFSYSIGFPAKVLTKQKKSSYH